MVPASRLTPGYCGLDARLTCTTCGSHSAEPRVVRDYLESRGMREADDVPTGAPRGEWSGRPLAGAAFGGSLSLTWLAPTVMLYQRRDRPQAWARAGHQRVHALLRS
jgi:hypothetical protein